MKLATRNYIALALLFSPMAIIWLSTSLGLEFDGMSRIIIGGTIVLALAWLHKLGQRRIDKGDRCDWPG